jgi:hypothetical protein
VHGRLSFLSFSAELAVGETGDGELSMGDDSNNNAKLDNRITRLWQINLADHDRMQLLLQKLQGRADYLNTVSRDRMFVS